jgi:hypothetical protein
MFIAVITSLACALLLDVVSQYSFNTLCYNFRVDLDLFLFSIAIWTLLSALKDFDLI